MSSPDARNGYSRIDDALLEALILHSFSKRQYEVLLAVIRKTDGFGKQEDA